MNNYNIYILFAILLKLSCFRTDVVVVSLLYCVGGFSHNMLMCGVYVWRIVVESRVMAGFNVG